MFLFISTQHPLFPLHRVLASCYNSSSKSCHAPRRKARSSNASLPSRARRAVRASNMRGASKNSFQAGTARRDSQPVRWSQASWRALSARSLRPRAQHHAGSRNVLHRWRRPRQLEPRSTAGPGGGHVSAAVEHWTGPSGVPACFSQLSYEVVRCACHCCRQLGHSRRGLGTGGSAAASGTAAGGVNGAGLSIEAVRESDEATPGAGCQPCSTPLAGAISDLVHSSLVVPPQVSGGARTLLG